MLVGAWMVGDSGSPSDRQALMDILLLYKEKAPQLLDKPGLLTDAMIAREIALLLENE